jgi:hypothetical protein
MIVLAELATLSQNVYIVLITIPVELISFLLKYFL